MKDLLYGCEYHLCNPGNLVFHHNDRNNTWKPLPVLGGCRGSVYICPGSCKETY